MKWNQEMFHGEPDGVNAFTAIHLGETSKWQYTAAENFPFTWCIICVAAKKNYPTFCLFSH